MKLLTSLLVAALPVFTAGGLAWWGSAGSGRMTLRRKDAGARRVRFVAGARSSEDARDRAVLLAMIDGMVAALLAGAAPAVTVTTSARLVATRLRVRSCRAALAAVADRAEAGDDLADVWADAARAVPPGACRQAVAAIARAWALAGRLGSPLVPGLRVCAATLHAELERDRRIAAASAGPRATMQVLTVLPVAGLALATLAGLAPWPVIASPLAIVTVAPGCGLILLGRLIARRMIAAAARPARVPA